MDYALLLPHFLKRATKLYGEKTAVIGDEKYLTYREFQARVNQLSRGLQALGIKKGDRVAYLATNTSEMLEGFYGVLQLGAIFFPRKTRFKAEENEYILITVNLQYYIWMEISKRLFYRSETG